MKELHIGLIDSFTKTLSEADVYGFAGISGDFNSVHVNEIKAEESRFGKRICHGMLVASFISTVLGMKLPGEGSVYLEQNIKFLKPVYLGDTITAQAEVIDIDGKIVTLKTIVLNQDGIMVIDGIAKVLVDG